jgi:alpha-1,3-mannosyl-glycoprotein beta-1,2-N-acetylglucosaminyltransferase
VSFIHFFSQIKTMTCSILFDLFFSGLFFEKHLKYIKLSENFVQFSKKDLSYLLKENYDASFMKEVYQTPVVTFEELRRGIVNSKGPVRIQYNNRNQYKSSARSLGIMDDFKV